MRDIKKLIVHCSATPEFKDFDVEDIREWHVKGNGWSDVGYHYIITLDGIVQEGRPVEKKELIVLGIIKDSIGVCYIGGMDKDMNEWKDTRTQNQIDSLYTLLQELKMEYPEAKVYGHRDFTDKKPCPSFDAFTEYINISNS